MSIQIQIPFTFKQESKVVYKEVGLRSWRHVLDVDLFSWTPGIGVSQEVKFDKGDWRSIHSSGLDLRLSTQWSWSEDHFWYDGPHCSWNRGFLRVFRGGRFHCEKCLGER